MADAYTDTTALANLVADGYDKVVNPPLRA